MPQRYLLSIDGGGVRGIIPLHALMQLEHATGRLTREIFSFVAGTSVGAIITAGIAAGVPAERILQLFVRHVPEVIGRWPWSPLKRVVAGSMYSTRALARVVAQTLGPAASWTLNDSPIDLLITAKRVSDGMPWYFVRDHPANSNRTGRLRLVDCVTASAAAPTYFRPWTMPEDRTALAAGWDPVGTLVDGGVGVAGNPVYQACVEAFAYTSDYIPEETTIVSLGTGRFVSYRQPTWLWPWLQWVVGELLRSPGEQQTEIVRRHFPTAPFYRIDPRLERSIELDDVRSLGRLQEIGVAQAQKIDWQAILNGEPSPFRITPRKTLWQQYSQA